MEKNVLNNAMVYVGSAGILIILVIIPVVLVRKKKVLVSGKSRFSEIYHNAIIIYYYAIIMYYKKCQRVLFTPKLRLEQCWICIRNHLTKTSQSTSNQSTMKTTRKTNNIFHDLSINTLTIKSVKKHDIPKESLQHI